MELQTSTWAHFNKAEYTATLVACGWAGAVLEKVTRASGQEPYAQSSKNAEKVKRGPTEQSSDRHSGV